LEQQVQENRGSQKWRGLGVSAAHEEPERHLAIVPFDHPEYENHDHLTVEMIEGLLRDKICSATRTDVVLKRETWLAFTRAGGSDRKGLKLPQMRTRLQQWGIRPNEKVMKEAFAKWDVDGSGAIDFDEFFMIVMPGDFTEKKAMMHDLAKGMLQKEVVSLNDVYLANIGARVNKRPNQLQLASILDKGSTEKTHTEQMKIHELVEVIRDKISCHSTGGNREMTDCYALFNRPKLGISLKDFNKKLNMWSLHASKEQLEEIFRMIDTDGNGKISFHEFLAFFGGENNRHPLHQPATATGGVGDRRLSFLPGRVAMEGAAIHRTAPEIVRNASGKSIKAMTDGHIATAGSKHNARRLVEPSFRSDRNGILRGGEFRSTEITVFLTRLLQNAHAQIIGQRMGGAHPISPTQLVESHFGSIPWITVTNFKKIVHQDLAGPLRMKPHIFNNALHYYSRDGFPTDDNSSSVDAASLLRDAKALAGTHEMKAKLEYNAKNMNTVKKHINAQQTGRSLVHPSFLTPHMTERTGTSSGYDKNGRRTTRVSKARGPGAVPSARLEASSTWNHSPISTGRRPEAAATPLLTKAALQAALRAATPALKMADTNEMRGLPATTERSTTSSYGSRHGLGRDEMRDLLRKKLRTAGAPRAPGMGGVSASLPVF
jgi:Ca2+-binding EF-hand superfamily protein